MTTTPFELLKAINPGRQTDGSAKPHKYALLLAIIDLYEHNQEQANCFHIDSTLENYFERRFRELAPTTTFSAAMIETPFFHLQSRSETDSMWLLHLKEDKRTEYEDIVNNKNRRFTKKRLLDIFSHATLNESLHQLLLQPEMRKDAIATIMEAYQNTNNDGPSNGLRRVDSSPGASIPTNPFVSYLNSLQRSGGGNENSLAESQACNAHFPSIHVEHPLAEIIYKELSDDNGTHVILTGHAGDGKSTLALEVYKRLRKLPTDQPLPAPPEPRENVGSISIIKDLSERNKKDDDDFIAELKGKQTRFLMVSNTGTLLDLVKHHPGEFGNDAITLESNVLDAIGQDSGEAYLELDEIKFRVFNLARMDNIALARNIFEKMIAPERWETCSGCPLSDTCPVHANVDLIQSNKVRVLDRIFLAYRRMYEYGTRLTMRQFTEHLAYMITAGLDEQDIEALHQQNPPPLISEYLFYNRFFGDNGSEKDADALEMKAVEEILEQGFGERPSPGWERKLWLHTRQSEFQLGVDIMKTEFVKLRNHGARTTTIEEITPDQAREQVRRLLYFLYDFPEDKRDYLSRYLNSPTLLDWICWQKPNVKLRSNERSTLEQKIYHVLQEHFTGVRLPEGSTQGDRRLYVTLSRRRSEVRQSAQVVLAQVDWSSSTALKLIPQASVSGETRQDLILCGKGQISKINLPLMLPFLDYVMMRHFGELGEVLEASYLERLDQFKAQVHKAAMLDDEDDRIMLVRLKTDHTFRRQHFEVNNNRLEVTDVL